VSEITSAPVRPHGALVSAAVTAVLFIILAVVVVTGQLTAADTRGILALRAYASPGVTAIMKVASLIGHGRVAIPVGLAILGSLYALGRRTDAALYAIACLGGEVVLLVIKELVHQHRPVGISPKLTDAGFYSFPSGHTMLAVIIFGLGALLLTGRAPWWARVLALTASAALVLLIGVSRIYLGAHWPSDVVGAVLAGTSWAAFSAAAVRRWRPAAGS
jgi:undecaprenyl-diphosphatase